MRVAAVAIIGLAALVCAWGASRAEDDPGNWAIHPVKTQLDALFSAQDRIAAGDANAMAEQRKLLLGLRSIDDDVWRAIPRRSSAIEDIASYVLSGGTLVPHSTPRDETDRRSLQGGLLEASISFMSGDRALARDLLAHVDPLALSPQSGGRIALARAMAFAEEPARPFIDLPIAAALMPGTLVEESALRRLTIHASRSARGAVFLTSLERYVRRFPGSPFLEDVLRNIGSLAASARIDALDGGLPAFDIIVGELDTNTRRKIYGEMMRAGFASSQWALCGHAAARLQRLSVDESREERLGELYVLLLAVATRDDGMSRRRLLNLRPDDFEGLENTRLRAAQDIAREVDGEIASFKAGPDDIVPEELAEIVASAHQAIAASDENIR